MAFVLELQSSSSQPYLRNSIVSTIRIFGISADVVQRAGSIICAFDAAHPQLSACLEAIADHLGASYHLTGSHHYENDVVPSGLPEPELPYALGLGLCPECQRDLFDPSGRRYYYPFTSCNHCGGQYAFFESYPFKRENTAFSYLAPCAECGSEQHTAGRHEQHQLNSCHACGTPVRLKDHQTERYANDAGSFRAMFEVAARAIADNKSVLIKTTMGYRRFYQYPYGSQEEVLLMIDAGKITEHLALINEEFNALLGIERPVLHAALKSERLREKLGTATDVKYPDDGFTLLLGAELQRLGFEYIAYTPADTDVKADLVMDYDLPLQTQSDLHLFINKEMHFVASGERVSFPGRLAPATQTLGVAQGLAAIPQAGWMLFDRPEHYDAVTVDRAVVVQEEEAQQWHSHQRAVEQDEAAFMAVVAEQGLFGRKCIGAHFEEELSFLYYDGKKMIRVVPAVAFDPSALLGKLGTLREGSDRLMENLRQQLPQLYGALEKLQEAGGATLFEATALVLGLEEHSFAALSRTALHFNGKGGLQVDTHVKDNRFDHTAYLASLISYRLAGVDPVLIAYSVFESLGDYVSDLLGQIKAKTKAEEMVLCGTSFAQPSLFSRLLRNLKQTPPRLNVNFPIGKENAVVGCAYL